MLKYIPLFELPVLIVMVLVRSAILGRKGIKVIVFGATDKSDHIMLPFIVFFLYGIVSSLFNLPFPVILQKPFWQTDGAYICVAYICAITLCTASLVWFAVTLGTFGRSFRVGIDVNTQDKLITHGTFSFSRNPIYLAFIVFFAGFFAAYPNIVSLAFLLLLIVVVHRQVLREEQFLKSHYGAEYEEYCKRVRRYTPFI